MADTVNRGGISTSHHDLDAPTTSRYPTAHEPLQKRTRSQLKVSDSILRLPSSCSPLKVARMAHARAQGNSPHPGSHGNTPNTLERGGVVAGMNAITVGGTGEAVYNAGEDEEMNLCADGWDQKSEVVEGTEDSLFDGRSHDEDSSSNPNQVTMPPTSTKKRASPDTDAIRALSSPGTERQSKRVKVEAFQLLGRTQEPSEYHEPLRNPDASTPGRRKGHKRVSSSKPMLSPSKATSSIFPSRAQSVPLDWENEVRAIDLISIPPSPRRLPSKGAIEVRRALSVPPPDEELMDIDVDGSSILTQFTNPTRIVTPRANPVFHYTVNFATPRGSATPSRFGLAFASPPSPLTPLPPSPPTEFLPEMQSLLAKKVNAKLLAASRDACAKPTASLVNPSVADTIISADAFQPVTHVPSRLSSVVPTSRQASVASGSSAASHSCLARPPLTSSNSTELIHPTTSARENNSEMTSNVAGYSGQAKNTTSNNADDAGRASTSSSADRSSARNSTAGPRSTLIGSMKPKRGPSVPQGRPMTRSVSVKEQRVKGDRPEIEDATKELPAATTSTVRGTSSGVAAMPPPSTTLASKLRPPELTSTLASKSKSPPMARRSTSLSKPPPDNKKQTSLNQFIKPKPSTAGGTTTTGGHTTSSLTGMGGSSRVAPPSSPSKIPLPASPSKRPWTPQHGTTKPFLFSLGTTSSGVGTGTPRATSGRSLSTLSHALDKLAAPPPSRPNTSMGFVRGEGTSDDEVNFLEGSKGKGKAKDDSSLPVASTAQESKTTFARPTASSLKRAATVTGFRSMAAARTRGRGGVMAGVSGRGKGTGIFGRAGDRASKKTNLPVVVGSPVKGSGIKDDLDLEGCEAGKHEWGSSLGNAKNAGGVAGDEDVFMSHDSAAVDGPKQDAVMHDIPAESSIGGSTTSLKLSPPGAANASNGVEIDLTALPVLENKGKQRVVPPSTLNPASSALHALSESLSSLPQTPTPPKPRAVGTRTGLRSSIAATKENPLPGGSGSVGNSEVHGSDGAGPSNGTVNGSGGAKKSSLKILKQCAIFVDVRTEQGDDAGSVFVEMLRGLGAKIMSRLGSRCTHIVYKNGHPNTLTRYRMLNGPKPHVVGIAWVVDCVEKRAKVDEERFKIDVDMINVAGGNYKRRRSMLPKHLIPASPGPDSEMPVHMSSEADEDDEGMGHIDGSPSQDFDLSIRSKEEEDLTPLERARRRRSILPGGQTRLFP